MLRIERPQQAEVQGVVYLKEDFRKGLSLVLVELEHGLGHAIQRVGGFEQMLLDFRGAVPVHAPSLRRTGQATPPLARTIAGRGGSARSLLVIPGCAKGAGPESITI